VPLLGKASRSPPGLMNNRSRIRREIWVSFQVEPVIAIENQDRKATLMLL